MSLLCSCIHVYYFRLQASSGFLSVDLQSSMESNLIESVFQHTPCLYVKKIFQNFEGSDPSHDYVPELMEQRSM